MLWSSASHCWMKEDSFTCPCGYFGNGYFLSHVSSFSLPFFLLPLPLPGNFLGLFPLIPLSGLSIVNQEQPSLSCPELHPGWSKAVFIRAAFIKESILSTLRLSTLSNKIHVFCVAVCLGWLQRPQESKLSWQKSQQRGVY